jgi:hypothetical protein
VLTRRRVEIRDEREALVIGVEDRPRTIGGVARSIGDAGVNIEPAYTTLGAVRLTLGIDGVERRGPRCSRSGGEWDAP